MTYRTHLLAGIAALFAAPAAGSVADFRLPTATPTPAPRAQGPVDPSLPPPRPATPTPTPPPTITASPLPAPTSSPVIIIPELPAASPTPAPAPRRTSAVPTPAPAPEDATTVAPTEPEPSGENAASAVNDQPLPGATPTVSPAEPDDEDTGSSFLPWMAGLLLLVGAGLGVFLWLRRRIGPTVTGAPPEIERPRIPPRPVPPTDPEPAPAPSAAAAPAAAAAPHPLHISVEPSKLAVTLMNATLGYRLTLTNRGPEPMEDIGISADLIGAHAALPREEQLAGPQTQLEERHRLAGLAPGESGELTGDLRLPLAMVRPIIQGKAMLLVPLARFRVSAREQEPRCFTVLVGQPSSRQDAAIQPVRLDLGPRIYDGLAGRAF